MAKAIIEIDASDGLEAFLREEPVIESEDDVARLVLERGYNTGQAGWMIIAARAAGIVPEHVLKTDRLHHYAGVRQNVNQIIERFKEEVELENGEKVTIRTYLAGPGRKPDEEEEEFEASKEAVESEDRSGYVKTRSEKGVALALRYLHSHIPGQIYPRLAELAAAGEDVRPIADMLIAQINEMVEKVT